jgi:hypothetical protein
VTLAIKIGSEGASGGEFERRALRLRPEAGKRNAPG